MKLRELRLLPASRSEKAATRAAFGKGHLKVCVVEKLAEKLEVSEAECRGFLAEASRKYKSYLIPKKSGGYRRIAQPSHELKRYQRAFMEIYQFPVHECAMGYVRGRSIKDNATCHVSNSYLFKTDISHFFYSIKPYIFWRVLSDLSDGKVKVADDVRGDLVSLHEELNAESEVVEQLLFWRPGKSSDKLVLSIGAPSSPVISNFCMFVFDEYMAKISQRQGVVYTRYVDDLTFSTNQKNILTGYMAIVRKVLYRCFSGAMDINLEKTIFSSKAHNRQVTGVTLANDGDLSIGRNQKRYIKHLVHYFAEKKLNEEKLNYLRGYLAFVRYIEPEFIGALYKKYSPEVMKMLMLGK